jgi:RNA polymerase sigma-70 factor (ECF subfamily)
MRNLRFFTRFAVQNDGGGGPRRMQSLATDELRDLYDRYATRIHTLARYTLGSDAAAEDAVQAIFLKAFEQSASFRGQAERSTWLWRIAVNHCTDELRRRKRVEEVPLDAVLGWAVEADSPEEHHAVKQIDAIVARGLLELSPKLRTVVALRYIDEMPYDEIASVLGCSIGTVSSRLSRALTELERILRPIIRS